MARQFVFGKGWVDNSVDYSQDDLDNLLAGKEYTSNNNVPSLDSLLSNIPKSQPISMEDSVETDIPTQSVDRQPASVSPSPIAQKPLAPPVSKPIDTQVKQPSVLDDLYGKGLGDADLAQAREKRDVNLFLNSLIKGGTQMASRGNIDTSGIDQNAKLASLPVDDILSGRKLKAEEIDLQQKMFKNVNAKDLYDPNSQISKLANEMAKKLGYKFSDGLSAGQLKDAGIDFDKMIMMREARDARAKEKESKLNLSPAQKSADMAFGKDFNTFIQGGEAKARSGIQALKEIRDRLGKENLTGAIQGSLPDWLRSIITPGSKSAQDVVDKTTVESLRQILGAQFTEQEGERIKKLSYDPKLPEKENIKKLDTTIKLLEKQLQDKVNAINHYSEYGTISNYKPVIKQEAAQELTTNNVSKYTPGTVITLKGEKHKGKKYKVDADGDTLIPLE